MYHIPGGLRNRQVMPEMFVLAQYSQEQETEDSVERFGWSPKSLSLSRPENWYATGGMIEWPHAVVKSPNWHLNLQLQVSVDYPKSGAYLLHLCLHIWSIVEFCYVFFLHLQRWYSNQIGRLNIYFLGRDRRPCIYIYTVLVSICIQTKVQSDQQCRHVRFRWCGIYPDLCHPRGFCKGSPAMAPALRKSLGTRKTHCHALLEDWEGNSQDNKFQVQLLFQTPFLEFHTEIWGFTFKASHPH